MTAGVLPEEVAPEPPASPAPSRRRPWFRHWWLLPLVLVLIMLVGAWRNRLMVDDGFIHLRVVKQIEYGHGPVWNAGERVEASTSPAWTWLLVVLDELLPGALEWIAVLTGIVLTIAGVWLAVLGARELTGKRASLVVPMGALVYCVLPAAWTNASTGLENGLVLTWLGASLYVLARWARRGDGVRWYEAAVVGFGPLVRPELALWTVGLLGAVVVFEWRARGVRRGLAALATGLALPVAYEIFRMGYYASLVPNSAIAKEAGLTFWSSGWLYLHQTLDPYWLLVPIVLVVVLGYVPLANDLLRTRDTRALTVLVAFGALAFLNALFVVRVGGDIYHARLLLTPLFGFVAPVMVLSWRRAYTTFAVLVVWSLAALFVLRTPLDAPRYLETGRNPITLRDYGGVTGYMAWYKSTGVYYYPKRVRGTPLPGRDPSVAAYGIGAVGYALGPNVYVLDLLGLGDAFTSHLHLGTVRGPLVAHEKPLPVPWIVARLLEPPDTERFAEFPLPGYPISEAALRMGLLTPGPLSERIADARVALKCGDIHDLLDATSGSLGFGKFLSNIVNAPRFTSMRFPADPYKARQKYCKR